MSLSDFFSSAAKLPLLTPQQEKELGKRAQAGDPVAISKLVEHNIRLAISIAKRWQNRGVPLEDLVQEATLGLDRAARKFDPQRGLRFTTYASWWVSHFLQRAVHNTGATIRVPAHVTVRRLAIEEALEERPNATVEELAALVECKPREVHEALASSRVVSSLDYEGDEVRSVHERIPDPNATSPDAGLFTDSRVRDALITLGEPRCRIIELRFGLDGPERTRREVAKILDLKESQVQTLQRSGMTALAELLSEMRPDHTPAGEAVSLPAEEDTVICSRKEPV